MSRQKDNALNNLYNNTIFICTCPLFYILHVHLHNKMRLYLIVLSNSLERRWGLPLACLEHVTTVNLDPLPPSECHSAGPGDRIAYEAKLGSRLSAIISRIDLAAHFKILKNVIFQLLHTPCFLVKWHSNWGRRLDQLGRLGWAVTFQNSPFLSIHHLFFLSFVLSCSLLSILAKYWQFCNTFAKSEFKSLEIPPC